MRNLTKLAACAAALTATTLAAPAVGHATEGADPSRAHFEGGTIDLAESWGNATACAELGDIVDCYRSEAELLTARPELGDRTAHAENAAAGSVALAATCSSSLRLYRSNGFGGSVLHLSTRLLAINLSTYGFDNDTSSYRVGSCAAAFYAGANLSGAQFPGSTGAYASASTMLTGWNNVVSSVIIF